MDVALFGLELLGLLVVLVVVLVVASHIQASVETWLYLRRHRRERGE